MNGTTLRSALFVLLFATGCYAMVTLLGLATLGQSLSNHWQYIDLTELANAPFHSLLYLHSQPPLLNFILWILMQLPGHVYNNFIWLNCICLGLTSLILMLIAHAYLRSFFGALALTLAYLFSPAALLNAAYPFYPCLTTAGYALLVYAFFILARKPHKALALFIFSTLYLTLLRSSFTWLHVLFFCGLFYMQAKPLLPRKIVFVAFLFSFCIGSAVPVKNYILYGFFGSSSWIPLNLAHGWDAYDKLPPFATPEEVKRQYPELTCEKSYGIVDRAPNKHNGEPNFNSCYIIAHANMLRAELWKNYRLENHAEGFLASTARYFSPPDQYSFLSNQFAIPFYANLVHVLNLNEYLFYKDYQIELLPIALILAAYLISRRTHDRFLFTCLITLACHFLTHTLTDGHESRRFVFDIEFLFFLFAASLFSALKIKDNIEAPRGIKITG